LAHALYGLKGKRGTQLSAFDGNYWNWPFDEIAEAIGKKIVENSPILQE
jgi:hypothetical protein